MSGRENERRPLTASEPGAMEGSRFVGWQVYMYLAGAPGNNPRVGNTAWVGLKRYWLLTGQPSGVIQTDDRICEPLICSREPPARYI